MRLIKTIAAGAALSVMLCIGGIASAQTVTDIKLSQSPHNLNNIPGAQVSKQQICLPCHTPHGATQSDPNNKGEFLWNHNTNWTTSYTLYTTVHSTRFSSSSSANPQLDSTSRLCLSCHDGAIAVDAYGGGQGNVKMGDIGAGDAKLGTDLSTSHPVGIGYPGLSADGKTFTASAASGYIDPTVANWGRTVTVGKTVGGGLTFEALPNGKTGIGCGTCHTPHAYTYAFVKMDNTGSQLCFKCHDK